MSDSVSQWLSSLLERLVTLKKHVFFFSLSQSQDKDDNFKVGLYPSSHFQIQTMKSVVKVERYKLSFHSAQALTRGPNTTLTNWAYMLTCQHVECYVANIWYVLEQQCDFERCFKWLKPKQMFIFEQNVWVCFLWGKKYISF